MTAVTLTGFSLRISVLAALAFMTGCVGSVSDNVAADFRKKWVAQHSAADKPYGEVNDKSSRNEFIDEYVAVKNVEFANYITAIRRGTSYGELTADGSRLVLDSLAAVTGGPATKAALAAASAGITGITGYVKKDVLFDQALPTFIAKMEELRAARLADITVKKKLPYPAYTRTEAFNDVEDYGRAGTFDAAIASLNAQSGQLSARAKAGLSIVKGDNMTAAVQAPTDSPAIAAASHAPVAPVVHMPRQATSVSDDKFKADQAAARSAAAARAANKKQQAAPHLPDGALPTSPSRSKDDFGAALRFMEKSIPAQKLPVTYQGMLDQAQIKFTDPAFAGLNNLGPNYPSLMQAYQLLPDKQPALNKAVDDLLSKAPATPAPGQ